MAVAVATRERVKSGRASPLRPVDLLLAGYLVVVSIVAIVRAPGLPNCWWLLGAHALFGVLLYLLTRPGLGPIGRSIREIYPLLLLFSLYSELDVLNGPGGTPVYDAVVQGWELAIFGTQASTAWWRTRSHFSPIVVQSPQKGCSYAQTSQWSCMEKLAFELP